MNGAQLKNSILQWAIQGKLVPQNPKDEPAQKLLERIAASRNESSLSLPKGTSSTSLRGAKATKQSKNSSSHIYRENGVWYEQVGTATPKDISDEIPFEIPENWAWCRLGNLIKISSGDGLVSKDMKKGDIPVFGGNGITGYHTEANVFEETVVIGRVGFYCGSVHVTPSKAWVTDNAFITDYPKNDINREFLVYCLKFLDLGKSHNATAQPVVSGKKIYPLLFPLPPLAEQKRIVAKLEQVLPLAEEYGTAQEQLDKLNRELPEALKKSILQQAIQGKLVPQNPKDEPAQKLLELIKAARSEDSLPKGTKSKKSAPTSRIYCENGVWYEQIGNTDPKDISDEIPFDIPASWVWCRLDCLGTFVRGNGIKRDETIPTGKPCVRYGEMYTTYKVKFSEVKSFTKKDIFDKCHKIHKNDILMALTGENKWDIALAATYQGDDEAAIGGDLCKFTPIECNPLYLVYLINSPYGIGYKRETSTGDIIVHTSVGKLGNFLVPLPPLAEQKRIVAKLEQLFKVL